MLDCPPSVTLHSHSWKTYKSQATGFSLFWRGGRERKNFSIGGRPDLCPTPVSLLGSSTIGLDVGVRIGLGGRTCIHCSAQTLIVDPGTQGNDTFQMLSFSELREGGCVYGEQEELGFHALPSCSQAWDVIKAIMSCL